VTWTKDAIERTAGIDNRTKLMIGQINLQHKTAKDKTSISSPPTAAKVEFMHVVSENLAKNTPSPLESEDLKSFLLRRSQREQSDHQQMKGSYKKAPKRAKKEEASIQKQQELERKK